MELTQDDILEIQRLLEASPYSELIVETGRVRITLRRAKGGAWIQESETLLEPRLASPSSQEPMSKTLPAGASAAPAAERGLVNILPPLPGTFYRAPKPGAAPFVEIGSSVTEDMVIGIIETMKLMNPARAKTAGTIVEICTANGELVETHSVLMRLRPSAGGRP